MRSQVVALLGAVLSFANCVTAAPAARYDLSSSEDACTLVTVYVTVSPPTTVDVVQTTTTEVEYSAIFHTSIAPGSTEVKTVYLGGSTQTIHVDTASSSDIVATSTSVAVTMTLYSKITLTKVRSTTTKTETIEVTYVYPTHKASNTGTVYLTHGYTTTLVIGTVDSTAALYGSSSTYDRNGATVYETVTGSQLEPTYVIETITVIPLSTTPPYVPPSTQDGTSTVTIRRTVSQTVMTINTAPTLSSRVPYNPTESASTLTAMLYKPIEEVSTPAASPCTTMEYSLKSSSVSSVPIEVSTSSFNTALSTSGSSTRFSNPTSTTIADMSTSISSLAAQSVFVNVYRPESSISLILPKNSAFSNSYILPVETSSLSAQYGFTAIPSSTTMSKSTSPDSSITEHSTQFYRPNSSSGVDESSSTAYDSMSQTYPMIPSSVSSSAVSSPAQVYPPPYASIHSTSSTFGASSAQKSPPFYPFVYPTNGRGTTSSSAHRSLPPYPKVYSTVAIGRNSSFISSQTSPPYPTISPTSATEGASSTSGGSAPQYYNMILSTGTSSGFSKSVLTTNPPYPIVPPTTSMSTGASSSNNISITMSYSVILSTGVSSDVSSSPIPSTSTVFTMGHFTFTFPKIPSSTMLSSTSSVAISNDSISKINSVTSTEIVSSSTADYQPNAPSFTITSFGGYSFLFPSAKSDLSSASGSSSLTESSTAAGSSSIEPTGSNNSSLLTSTTSAENIPSTTFSLVPHLTSTLTASSTVSVTAASSSSVTFSSYTFSTFTSSSTTDMESVASTAAASSTGSSVSMSTDSSSAGESSSSVDFTQSTTPSSSNLVVSTTTNPASSGTSTTVPATTSCGPSGDFTLNFDDIPPLAAPDNTTNPEPIFSPYHKFWFLGGLVVVPPPVSLYLPSSGNLFLELLKNFTTSGSPADEIGSTAEIGTGPDEGLACFGFNVIGASVGCNSTGPTCDWQFTGLQYNPVTDVAVEIATQYISTPACAFTSNCALVPVTLDAIFQDITSVRINATVTGLPVIWWLDDLQLGWTDNSCDAATCRQNHR